VLLALVERAGSDRKRRSQVLEVIDSVADLLGNTRAIARSSYIHPRVIDLFHEGRTLPASEVTGVTPDRPLPYPARVERAVVNLLA
jgi:DNA topoisomerase IB